MLINFFYIAYSCKSFHGRVRNPFGYLFLNLPSTALPRPRVIPSPTATAQQKGERVVGGYIHHYKKKNVAQAEAILRDALLPYVPETPIEDRPIWLNVVWMFPYPKSAKKHKPGWARKKITRPDTDNLNKLLKDVMTDMGFWKDDAQVCVESISKRWARQNPGIRIKVVGME